MDINERIRLIMSDLGVSNNAFAKSINVNPVVTHNIISGRLTKPSYELLEKILLTYDNINADWLICGRGEKFVDRNTTKNPPQKSVPTKSNDTTIEILQHQLTQVNHVNSELLELLKKR